MGFLLPLGLLALAAIVVALIHHFEDRPDLDDDQRELARRSPDWRNGIPQRWRIR